MSFELTPIWDAMLEEYDNPLVVEPESIPNKPTEHPIYDEIVTEYPDPLIKENQ